MTDKKQDFLELRDYKKWTPIKCNVNNQQRFRTFSEGQIWWTVVGENVGSEINGKGDYFLRPVLILKKNNRLNFIGIPLTTQAHEGFGYVKFNFKGRTVFAVLNQIKTFSVFRLMRKKGEADDSDMVLIRENLKDFLGF